MGFKLRSPSFRSAEKEVSRANDTVTNTVEDAWDDTVDVVKDVLHKMAEIDFDILDFNIEAMDFITDDILGISGAWTMLENISTAGRYVTHGIIEGDKQAIKVGVIVAIAVIATIYSVGAASPYLAAALAWGIPTVGAGLLVVFAVVSIAASIYSLYGLAVSLSDLGEMIKAGSIHSIYTAYAESRSAMDLAFTNAWINGSMNMWMPGGVLYDSPRAGDIRFNVDGHLGTTHFLNMQDLNTSKWSEWKNGNYHEYATETFGNLAGDTFFAVSPLAQRI